MRSKEEIAVLSGSGPSAGPVMLHELGNPDAESLQIVLQRSDSALVTVAGQDGALVFHQLGEISVFPPGAAQASSTVSPGFGSSNKQAAAVLGSWM